MLERIDATSKYLNLIQSRIDSCSHQSIKIDTNLNFDTYKIYDIKRYGDHYFRTVRTDTDHVFLCYS